MKGCAPQRWRAFRACEQVIEGGTITAGNASQLSDGASAQVVMEAGLAQKMGLNPLGAYRGVAVAGCEPDEMGIGPVYAIPKLLKQHGLTVDDIGLWELNEAFAVQVLYCRDQLGIDNDKLNVDGGAIAVGTPLRHEWLSFTGSRFDRGQAPGCEIRRGHNVCWRWYGCRWTLRGLLI
jgi:acetyl-CoA C-acetyltransferase